MHFRPAKVLCRDHLSCRRLHQWRTSEKDRALVSHDNTLIAHGGYIGAPRRTGSHDNGDLRDTERGHVRLIIKTPAKMITIGEHILLVRQVRPAGIDEIDAGKPVFERNFLRPQMLLHSQRVISTTLHRCIIADDNTFAPLDAANAGNDTGGMNIAAIHIPGRHLAELKKGGAGIKELANPFAREQLATRKMLLPRAFPAAQLDGRDFFLQILNQRGHLRSICLEVIAAGVEVTF